MELRELHIVDFKAFEGYHRIGLYENATEVIGRNGTGKSSLISALGFLFGDSAKTLGVKNYASLVYGNADGNEATAGECRVFAATLVGGVVHRFGRTASTDQTQGYYVDDQKPKSLSAYIRGLQSIGILAAKSNFNIIPQDAVTFLSTLSARQMMAFFERVAGSDEPATIMRRAEAKVLGIAGAMAKISEPVASYRTRVVDLRNRYKQHEAGLRGRELIKQLEQLSLFADIWLLTRETRALMDQLEQSEGTGIENQIVESVHKLLVFLSHEIGNQNRFLVAYRDRNVIPLCLLRERLSKRSTDLKNELVHVGARLQSLKETMARSGEDERRIRELLGEKESELVDVESEITKLKEGISRTALSDDQKRELSEADSRFVLENFEETELIKQMKNSSDENASQRTQLELVVKELTSNLKILEEDLRCVRDERELARSELNELESINIPTKRQRKIELENEEQECETRLIEIKNEIAEASLRNSKRFKESKNVMRVRAVSEMLQTEMKSEVLGLLSDLVEAKNPEHSSAFRRVLGKRLSSIVVSTPGTVARCVKMAQKSAIPTIRFVTLINSKVDYSDQAINAIGKPGLQHFEQLCKPTAQCPRASRASIIRVVRFFSRNVCFCEEFKVAQRAVKEFEGIAVVVAGGSLLKRSGLLTFGGDDDALSEQQPQKDRLHDESRILNAIPSYNEELIKRRAIEDELDEVSQCLEVSVSRQARLKKDSYKADAKIRHLTGDIDSGNESLRNLRSELDALISLDKSSVQAENLEKAFLERRKENIRECSAFDESLSTQIFELLRIPSDAEANIPDRNLEVERIYERRLRLEQDRIDIVGRLERAQQEQRGRALEDEKLRTKSTTLTANVEDLGRQLGDIEPKLEACRDLWKTKIQQLRANQEQYRQLLEECREKLPGVLLEPRSRARILGEVREKSETLIALLREYNRVREHRTERNATNLDYSKVPKSLLTPGKMSLVGKYVKEKLSEACREAEDRRGYRATLSTSRGLIDHADFNRKKIEILRRIYSIEMQNLPRIWKIARDRRNALLKNVVAKVKSAVPQTYKWLCGGDDTGNGAKMDLIVNVTDGDEYFKGSVMIDCFPPNTRYTPFDRLSGGQKSMACLALQLAIQEVLMVPLLIVDEVDKMLSASNCKKFGSLVREYADAIRQVILVTHRDPTMRAVNPRNLIGISRGVVRRETSTFQVCFDDEGRSLFTGSTLFGDKLAEDVLAGIESEDDWLPA